jgi:hypothetical protein
VVLETGHDQVGISGRLGVLLQLHVLFDTFLHFVQSAHILHPIMGTAFFIIPSLLLGSSFSIYLPWLYDKSNFSMIILMLYHIGGLSVLLIDLLHRPVCA